MATLPLLAENIAKEPEFSTMTTYVATRVCHINITTELSRHVTTDVTTDIITDHACYIVTHTSQDSVTTFQVLVDLVS